MGLNAGDLNRRVAIERATDTPDGAGGQISVWGAIGTVWVKASPVASKEALVAGTLRASQAWRLEMRVRDVTVADRLRPQGWKGFPEDQVLGIASVADPDGRCDSLVLFCNSEPE